MLEVTAFIILLEGVDKDEYFGFGQCLRSWVQPLTFNFCLLHAHQEESRKIQEVPKGKETIVTNFK